MYTMLPYCGCTPMYTHPNVGGNVRIIQKKLLHLTSLQRRDAHVNESRANGAVVMKNVTFPLIK